MSVKSTLKEQWEQNPLGVLTIGTLAATSLAKVIDSLSAAQGRRAYAKSLKLRARRRR